MYICNKCGATVSELPTRREPRGEFWGAPCYETYADAECSCGGYFVPLEYCTNCNSECVEDETECGLCPNCQEEAIERFYKTFSKNEQEYILWALS